MNIHAAVICFLLSASLAFGSLYSYPENKRPAVSLKEACVISETILRKLALEDYYVLNVTILGDEGQTGDGAWTLMYRNVRGDQIQISIYLIEDFCVTTTIPKKGKSVEGGYTRDGNVSKKWLEWEAKMKKEKEESDAFWDAQSKQAIPTERTEQDGADQPATAPKSKLEGKDKPQPESELAPR